MKLVIVFELKFDSAVCMLLARLSYCLMNVFLVLMMGSFRPFLWMTGLFEPPLLSLVLKPSVASAAFYT